MEALEALKTICGAIHYTLVRYSEKEISDYDWKYLCSYIGDLKPGTVYCVEVFQDGFLLTTKEVSLRYFHHDMHGQRLIDLKKKTGVS